MKVFNILKPVILAIIISTVLYSCAGQTLDTVEIEISGIPFQIELAVTQDEKATGLMHRKKLDPNRGMLFVYDYDKKMSFWMKNTEIPLSIAYISSDGIVKEIYDMEPNNLNSVESKKSVRYALELNAGRFDELGIIPGTKLFDPEIINRK